MSDAYHNHGKTACIVAAGVWGGSRCLLKNRDRNYTPKLKAYHEVRNGVEVLYIRDEGTEWLEGMNEHGIGIVNSALQVGRDEAEKQVVKEVGKKSKDGERILKTLEETTLDEALEVACTFKGGIKGHSFISDAKRTVSVEATRKHDCVTKTVSGTKIHVRTNHGIHHPDAGYREDTEDYVSSVYRRDRAKKILRTVSKPEDIAPALYREQKGDGESNSMVRKTDNMRTSSQLVLDLTKKVVRLYLLPGEVDFEGIQTDLPDGFEPKLKLKVYEYEDVEKYGDAEAHPVKLASVELLPIMDPQYNLREVCKQLILLEDHLFHPRKRCLDCIRKHLLTAEALAEETVTLDVDGTFRGATKGLADRIREAWTQVQNVNNDGAPSCVDIAQSVRQIRKPLVDVCFHVRVASFLNEPDAPSPSRVASTFGVRLAAYFSVGDHILYGKYKNKAGRILRFYRDDRGLPHIEVEPVPKGRKHNKQIGLFKVWHADMEKRAAKLIQFPDRRPARPKHTLTISGKVYALSSDGGPLGDPVNDEASWFGDHSHEGPKVIQPPVGQRPEPYRFLWAYDTERGDVGMWRVTDGNEKVYGGADHFRAKLVKLDGLGELNRVPTSEMRVIEREMRKLEDEHHRELEKWLKEHETDYQKVVNQVAQEVFDKQIAPDLERRLQEVAQGVVPFGFKVNDRILEHEDEAAQVRGHVIAEGTARFTSDMVEDELRRRGIDPDAEGHDIQAAHWAVEDIRVEAWKRYKRASAQRAANRYMQRLAGTWGYSPWDGDAPHDMESFALMELNHDPAIRYLRKEFEELDKHVDGDGEHDYWRLNRGWAWVGSLYLVSKALHGVPRDLVQTALEFVEAMPSDPKYQAFRDGWKEPQKFVEALRLYRKDLAHELKHGPLNLSGGKSKNPPDNIYLFDRDIPELRRRKASLRIADEHMGEMLSRANVSRVAAKYKNKKKVKTQDGDEAIVYEYSEGQVAHRNRAKAKRIEALRKSIGKLRTQVKKDLTAKDPEIRLVALAVALLDDTFERVGNDGSAKDGHFGVTGWKVEHVKFSGGKATFTYVGKSGVDQKKTVSDGNIITALKKATEGKEPGDNILCDTDGTCRVTSTEVNAYLKPFDITAKDIRGLHANEQMKTELKKARKGKLPEDKKERDEKLKEEFKRALEAAASAVGHEPATLKSQYLVPGLEDAYLKDGTVPASLDKTAGAHKDVCSQSWDGRFGWIDPRGRLVPIDTSHLRWAEEYLAGQRLLDEVNQGRGTAQDYLLRQGWVRVVDFRNFEVARGVRPSGAVLKTLVDIVVGCLAKLSDRAFGEYFHPYAGERIRLSPLWEKSPQKFLDAFVSQDRAEALFSTRVGTTKTAGAFSEYAGAKADRDHTHALQLAYNAGLTLDEWQARSAQRLREMISTKTRTEKEDEAADDLIRQTPKKKPPRKDLHNRRLPDEEPEDGDAKQDRKDQSQNWKDGTIRRAWQALEMRVAKPSKGQKKRQQFQQKKKVDRGQQSNSGHGPGETWQTESGNWSGKSKDGKKTQGGFEDEEAAKAWISTGKMPPKEEKPSDSVPAEDEAPTDAETPSEDETEAPAEDEAKGKAKALPPQLTPEMEERVKDNLKAILKDDKKSKLFDRKKLDEQLQELTGKKAGRGQQAIALAREVADALEQDGDPEASRVAAKLRSAADWAEEGYDQFSKLSPEEQKAEKERVAGVLKTEAGKQHAEYLKENPDSELTSDDFYKMLKEQESGYGGTIRVTEDGKIEQREAMKSQTDEEKAEAEKDRAEDIRRLEESKKGEAVEQSVQEVTKLTKELLKPGQGDEAELPREFQKKVTDRLNQMNPNERKEFTEAMAAEIAAFPKNPPMGQEALDQAREALGADFRTAKPAEAGKFLAQAFYAERVTFNPLMLGGMQVSDETEPSAASEAAKDEDFHTQRSIDAKAFYANANEKERSNAIAACDDALQGLDEDSPRAQEIAAIRNGIGMAAILAGEEPRGLEVSDQFVHLANAMSRVGEENRLLGTVNNLGRQESQKAIRSALETMTDEEIASFIGYDPDSRGGSDHPMSGFAEALLARDSSGKLRLSDSDRAQMRGWIEQSIVEDIAYQDPLIGDYLDENEKGNTREARRKVKNKATKSIYRRTSDALKKALGVTDIDVPSGSDNEARASTEELIKELEQAKNDAHNAVGDYLEKTYDKKPKTENTAIAEAIKRENSSKAITQRKIKPSDKPKKVKREPGDVWTGSDGKFWAKTPNGDSVGPIEDKEKAEAWANGEVGERQRRASELRSAYDFTPWREIRGMR